LNKARRFSTSAANPRGPARKPVSEAEELRRVIPVIEKLAAKTKIALSIDTMKPAVARAALAAGASIVNDVAANRLTTRCGKLSPNFAPVTFACTRKRPLCTNPQKNIVAKSASFFRSDWKN
jgi:dihydropteroate synthase